MDVFECYLDWMSIVSEERVGNLSVVHCLFGLIVAPTHNFDASALISFDRETFYFRDWHDILNL